MDVLLECTSRKWKWFCSMVMVFVLVWFGDFFGHRKNVVSMV